jgi:hypothetical protein
MMAFQCKKCNHLVFHTTDQLKNHLRIHTLVCKVKFPVDGFGLQKEATLQRAKTGMFKCSSCLTFESKYHAKIQAHYKNCIEAYCSSTSGRSNSDVSNPIQPLWIMITTHISSFFVNNDLHVAICQLCQYVVDVGSISQHAIKLHGLKVDLEQLS